ncbi:mechanosensitive ion channel family protein [Massilia solisilvae]|uniref:Mechanosensitive ion channel family protein n=1 Tax=Massilia solisilvae TaxID=1811225 RepID=A0ABT2BLY7_9BURK|nr:mechanosensitive ion channel family protein [Massilia solisilvae]MCS0609514.1 mechanosensitive ion channel family protein [Massilia solisilvae]
MNYVFLDNTTSAWTAATAIAVAVTLGLVVVKRVLVRRLGVLAARTETRIDDIAVAALDSTHLVLLAAVGLYAGAATLRLSAGAHLFLQRAAITAALLQVAIWADRGVRAWLGYYRARRDEDPARATSAAAIGFVARLALWAIIALMVLDNLGFNITTLVASLGIGGIAVALAVQNILGDLFASLSIVLDKPFVIGDSINVSGVAGTVEHVGLKTTRVRSLNGEQIVFSNADLLKSRIHNMKRMESRRIVFTIGVVYGISESDIRVIPQLIENIIRAQPAVTFDRAHFSGFGPSSLNFEAVYIVNDPDFKVYMDVQQEIYVQLYVEFGRRGIEFAFPTQTLHLVDAAAVGVTSVAGTVSGKGVPTTDPA